MRVGVIPFRMKKGKFEICLVSSMSEPNRMTFPKGLAKRGEAWEKAALRELHEEAGCKGKIVMRRMPLAVTPRRSPKSSFILFWCEIDKVKDSWPEKKKRERIWHTVGKKKDFRLTRNAKKIYEELLELGLGKGKSSTEGWIKERLEDSERRSA